MTLLVYRSSSEIQFQPFFTTAMCTHTEKGLFPKPTGVWSRPSLSLFFEGFAFAHHLSKMCPPSIKSGVIRKTQIMPMAGQSGRNGPAGKPR